MPERGPADLVLALAIIHHLAISNNVPLERIADFLYTLGGQLIVEFVPKSDSQTQKLLHSREDIFENYTAEKFEEAFQKVFVIVEKKAIQDTQRCLYLMKRKPH